MKCEPLFHLIKFTTPEKSLSSKSWGSTTTNLNSKLILLLDVRIMHEFVSSIKNTLHS